MNLPFSVRQVHGTTIRLTRDGRLVYRNYFTHDPKVVTEVDNNSLASKTHIEAIKARWPKLGELKLPCLWGGSVAITRDQGTLLVNLIKVSMRSCPAISGQ